MKVLCIGNVSYDITTAIDYYPEENKKYRVKSIMECGGGPASNAAYLLGKWGIDTTFAGVIGNDFYGNEIEKEFNFVNVDTKYLKKRAEKTNLALIIANTKLGSRTVMSRSKNHHVPIDIKEKYDIILADGHEFENTIKVFKENTKAIKVIDAGSLREETHELAHMVDYLICSKDFAEASTKMEIDIKKPETLSKAYKKLKNEYKNNIIITLEADGALYSLNGLIKVMPSIKVNPKDSTGAGDIFHGAFVYGLATNLELEENIKQSNLTAALSVEILGGRHSILSLETIKEKMNEFKRSNIHK